MLAVGFVKNVPVWLGVIKLCLSVFTGKGPMLPPWPVCANGTLLEGTVILLLPSRYHLGLNEHPWAMTYDNHKKSRWEWDDEYCYDIVLPDYGIQVVLDLVDKSIFDYIIQNGDRHTYEIYKGVHSSRALMLDNANGFGTPNEDLRLMLAPLYQCCRVRYRTYNRLKFLTGAVLSEVLAAVLGQDKLAPILTVEHLHAVDRRLKHVVAAVESCISQWGADKVLYVDI